MSTAIGSVSTNTGLTGATYDFDGGQQRVGSYLDTPVFRHAIHGVPA